jgi:hypothetical protein
MWYRCVHPYLTGLELRVPAALKHAREAWDHHVAAVWDELVRRSCHRMAADGMEWEAAGRYWEGRKDTGIEWDAVSVTLDRRHAMLGECKWCRKMSKRDLARLVRQVKSRARPSILPTQTIHEAIFLPSTVGLPKELDGVRLIDAQTLLRSEDQASGVRSQESGIRSQE